jgi:hypothetical protein
LATYRLLQDHAIGQQHLPAGNIVSDTGPGAALPVGWLPPPNVDPLDAGAVTAFYSAGPILPGPIHQQFTTQPVPNPTTYWKQQPNGQYALVGLGAALAPQWPWRI